MQSNVGFNLTIFSLIFFCFYIILCIILSIWMVRSAVVICVLFYLGIEKYGLLN